MNSNTSPRWKIGGRLVRRRRASLPQRGGCPGGAGDAVGATEHALAGAGAEVEPVVAERAGQLAAEERAVAADLVAGVERIVGQERAARRAMRSDVGDGAEDASPAWRSRRPCSSGSGR